MAWTHAGLYDPEDFRYPDGSSAAGASFEVRQAGALVPIYSDRDRSATLPNPGVVDVLGNLTFYAEPGRYQLKVDGRGVAITFTISVTPDAEDLSEGGDLTDVAFVDEANVFTELQTVQVDLVEGELTTALSLKAAFEGSVRDMASIFGLRFEVEPGFTLETSGLIVNRYNPLTGQMDESVGLLTHSLAGVNDEGEVVYRWVFAEADSADVPGLLSRTLTPVTAGDPVDDSDLATKRYVDAEIADIPVVEDAYAKAVERVTRDKISDVGGGIYAIVGDADSVASNVFYEHPDFGAIDGNEFVVRTKTAVIKDRLGSGDNFLEELTQYRNPDGVSIDQDNYEKAKFVRDGTVHEFVEYCQTDTPFPVQAGEYAPGRMNSAYESNYEFWDTSYSLAIGTPSETMHRILFDNGSGVWQEWMYRRVFGPENVDYVAPDGTWWRTIMEKVGDEVGSIADAGNPWRIGYGYGRMAVWYVTASVDGVPVLDFHAEDATLPSASIVDRASGELWVPAVDAYVVDTTSDGLATVAKSAASDYGRLLYSGKDQGGDFPSGQAVQFQSEWRPVLINERDNSFDPGFMNFTATSDFVRLVFQAICWTTEPDPQAEDDEWVEAGPTLQWQVIQKNGSGPDTYPAGNPRVVVRGSRDRTIRQMEVVVPVVVGEEYKWEWVFVMGGGEPGQFGYVFPDPRAYVSVHVYAT